MTPQKEKQALILAWHNDAVFTDPYLTEKYLDKLVSKGLLENKHKTKLGNIAYWISQKGLDRLFPEENNK